LSLVRSVGNQRGTAALLVGQGLLEAFLDRGSIADACTTEAAALFDSINDSYGWAVAIGCEGATALARGDYDEAEVRVHQSLPIVRDTGDLRFQAYALRVLGAVRVGQGRSGEAVACFREGLAVARSAGYRFAEAYLLCWLARVLGEREDQRVEADALIQEGLATFVALGNRGGEANALVDAADLFYRQGRNNDSQVAAERAIAISRDLGDRSTETYGLQLLGQCRLEAGRPEEAVPYLLLAIKIAHEIERPPLAAQALSTLGEAYHRLGSVHAARDAFQAAVDLHGQLGTRPPTDLLEKLAGQGQLTHSSVPSANT